MSMNVKTERGSLSVGKSTTEERVKQEKVRTLLERKKPCISVEFFPPKHEKGWDIAFESVRNLEPIRPSYVSVTCGAMGSDREPTDRLVSRFLEETDLIVVAHLTCRGASRDDIHRTLDRYSEMGVRNILALRGDPLPNTVEEVSPDQRFSYAAELVDDIKTRYPEMGVGVAGFPEGHPDTPNRLLELGHLKAKVDAGADYVVTQLFFDNRDYYDFCQRCELAGIKVPVIPGIMPITSRLGMYRIADIAKGSRLPATLIRAVERAPTREHVKNVGLHWATEQARDLLANNVPGMHFYTLNKSDSFSHICNMLGVKNTDQLCEPPVDICMYEAVTACKRRRKTA